MGSGFPWTTARYARVVTIREVVGAAGGSIRDRRRDEAARSGGHVGLGKSRQRVGLEFTYDNPDSRNQNSGAMPKIDAKHVFLAGFSLALAAVSRGEGYRRPGSSSRSALLPQG